MTHRIEQLHYPRDARLPAVLLCSCGHRISAWPDRASEDIWQPIPDAWLAHRRANGLRARDEQDAAPARLQRLAFVARKTA